MSDYENGRRVVYRKPERYYGAITTKDLNRLDLDLGLV